MIKKRDPFLLRGKELTCVGFMLGVQRRKYLLFYESDSKLRERVCERVRELTDEKKVN